MVTNYFCRVISIAQPRRIISNFIFLFLFLIASRETLNFLYKMQLQYIIKTPDLKIVKEDNQFECIQWNFSKIIFQTGIANDFHRVNKVRVSCVIREIENSIFPLKG